jgi:hypothetical protein
MGRNKANTDKEIRTMVEAMVAVCGEVVSRADVLDYCNRFGIKNPNQFTKVSAGWGLYDVSGFLKGTPVNVSQKQPEAVEVAENETVSSELSEDEIRNTQRRLFGVVDRMVQGVINGSVRAMVIAGPPGIGKTYGTEYALESAEADGKIKFTSMRGYSRATGLFKLLYENSDKNCVLLIDDADNIFNDDVSMNLLKTALDTSHRRIISWRSEKTFTTELGDEIPRSFEFKGSVIFITNLNFEKIVRRGGPMAPHMEALMSRSFYVDLNMDSDRERLIRIFDVLENSDMPTIHSINGEQVGIIKSFLKDNYNRMRELSLRSVVKLVGIMRFAESVDDFKRVAEVTCLKK